MPPSAEIALLYYVLTSTKLVLFSCVMKQNDGAKSLLADCFADLIKKQNLETSHHQHGNQGSHYFTHVIVDAETRRTIRQYLRSFPELLLLEENQWLTPLEARKITVMLKYLKYEKEAGGAGFQSVPHERLPCTSCKNTIEKSKGLVSECCM